MALFTMTFDTVTKEAKASFDGVNLENLDNVSMTCWPTTQDGVEKYCGFLDVITRKYEKDAGLTTKVHVMATENGLDYQEEPNPQELRKSIAKFMGAE